MHVHSYRASVKQKSNVRVCLICGLQVCRYNPKVSGGRHYGSAPVLACQRLAESAESLAAIRDRRERELETTAIYKGKYRELLRVRAGRTPARGGAAAKLAGKSTALSLADSAVPGGAPSTSAATAAQPGTDLAVRGDTGQGVASTSGLGTSGRDTSGPGTSAAAAAALVQEADAEEDESESEGSEGDDADEGGVAPPWAGDGDDLEAAIDPMHAAMFPSAARLASIRTGPLQPHQPVCVTVVPFVRTFTSRRTHNTTRGGRGSAAVQSSRGPKSRRRGASPSPGPSCGIPEPLQLQLRAASRGRAVGRTVPLSSGATGAQHETVDVQSDVDVQRADAVPQSSGPVAGPVAAAQSNLDVQSTATVTVQRADAVPQSSGPMVGAVHSTVEAQPADDVLQSSGAGGPVHPSADVQVADDVSAHAPAAAPASGEPTGTSLAVSEEQTGAAAAQLTPRRCTQPGQL
jgi:hypothetical protein